jgi:outer membrane autotransporter protein
LIIEVASSTNFDKLNIDGHASLGGTLRVVQLNGYQPQLGDRLVFLTAGGGVSGTFSTTHNDFLGTLVRLDVVYEADDVVLVGTQNSFTNAFGITTKKAKKGQPVPQPTSILGITPNQIAVALALDSALFDSRQAKVLSYLDGIEFSTVPHQLDKIAPEELTAIYTLGFAQLDAEVLSLQQRLGDIRIAARAEHPAPPPEEVRRAKPADKEPVNIGLPEEDHYGFFLTETGDFASAGDTYNANGFNTKSAGTTLGIDVRLSKHFVLGLMLEYERTDSDLIDNGHLRVDGGKAALYAMYHDGGFFTEGLVGGGYNSYDTSRSALQGTARGRTDGGQLDTYLGVGWDKPVGPVVITPIGSLLYSVVGIQGFDEFGSLQPLHIASQNESSMRGRVGMRVSHTSQFHTASLTSSLSAQWQHEFLNDDLALESSFANGAGAPFVVHGPRIGRDSALLTAAFNVQWSAYAAYLAYQADLGRKNYENQTVLVGFRVSW